MKMGSVTRLRQGYGGQASAETPQAPCPGLLAIQSAGQTLTALEIELYYQGVTLG